VNTGPSSAVSKYLSALFQSGTPAALSDGELLEQFITRLGGHDETVELAFAALLARHGPMVLRVCRAVLGDRHEVEDAFQATFLILAVRAQSIRRQGSVASWLHGVALRVSAAERARAMRRRLHERRSAVMTAYTTEETARNSVLDNDLANVIQEEIGRLPEKYRAVVVLCYLEGMTHEMAAAHLGWPVGSVHSRLAWARVRLRARLARRGLAPTTVPFDGSGPATDPEPAASPYIVPAALAAAATRGALSTGRGKGALAGIVSAESVALMEGVVKSMTTVKLTIMTAAVVLAGLITAGAGVLAYSPPRPNDPLLAIAPEDHVRQSPAAAPAAVPPIAQNPPRPDRATPPKDRGPLVIQAEVVDSQGQILPGVDINVAISYLKQSEDWQRVTERAVSDHDGRIRSEFPRESADGTAISVDIWAHQPGRAIAMADFGVLRVATPPVTRLALEQPVKRTITVLGADDRPIEGLRLVPRAVGQRGGRSATEVPDELVERLTVTTDAKGVAILPYLPQGMEPLRVQVAGAGIAMHTLSLNDFPQTKTLRIGRTGRLVGIVRGESGQPLADVSVVVCTPARTPSGRSERRPEMIRFDAQPLTTGRQGAFQTPSTLLNGSRYRVSIRQDGFAPFVSDWVTLGGDRTPVPPIRLRALRHVAGQVLDRQGRPVGGARVFLRPGEPSTVTDVQGRFDLRNVLPGKTFVLVQQPGFRFQGWPVDPATLAGELQLTLVRMNEVPDREMTALAEPIPLDEARALAARVLEPYLQKVLEKGAEMYRPPVLEALSTFNLDRAIELFKRGMLEDEPSSNILRENLSRVMAESDPAGAEAVFEAISDATQRARGLLTLSGALPASKRAQKRQFLEKVAPLVRGMPDSVKVTQIAAIAEAWLDLGEVERAKQLLLESLERSDALPDSLRSGRFLAQLSRLEPELALARIQKIADPRLRDSSFENAAMVLAIAHPAEAERFFNLSEGRATGLITLPLSLCRRLARVDPPRARRVAASLSSPGGRVCAWAYVALGLVEQDRPAALAALDDAIAAIDQLRELGPGLEPGVNQSDVLVMYPTNPAALILPLVERIAPERLAEFFWRAVALHSQFDVNREDRLRTSYIGKECMLLARYDRDVANVLFEPMDSYLRSLTLKTSESRGFTASAIVAKACLDPQAAVALVDALPAAEGLGQSEPANRARIYLAEALGQPPEKRWVARLRRLYELPFDD
jgi:RNA polymerase sigma factor (sigma-70 family)